MIARVLYKSFIKPFYKENAGTFVFVFTMFFFIVGTVDGADLFRYHYGLIKAILSIHPFLYAALLLWIFYSRKCAVFIVQLLRQPSYEFIAILKSLPSRKQYRLFFIVDFILLLPITFYITLVIAEGIYLHAILSTSIVFIFQLAALLILPARHVWLLNHPGRQQAWLTNGFFRKVRPASFYPFMLARAVFTTQKIAWAGIKVYTCVFLYFITVNNSLTPDSLHLTFLFFSFGVLANGVFINRIRSYEEQYLSFYRTLPVSIARRLIQYACFSLVLIVPEVLLLCILALKGLGYFNALSLGLYAFTTLVLLTSLSFLKLMPLKHFVKTLLVLFSPGTLS